MDFRKIFSTIPDKFDKYRPRYCDELFMDLIEYTSLAPGKMVLEVGPGTGQATDPILKTGCSYLAIELAENFVEFMAEKCHADEDKNGENNSGFPIKGKESHIRRKRG
jgi:phospholipid N-methyltransferase